MINAIVNNSNYEKLSPTDKSMKSNSNNDYSKRVWDKIDDFLNLGSTKDINLTDLSPDEKKQYFSVLAKIMNDGIAGYNYYKVNGKIEKHYLVNTIGDSRLYGAKKIYDKYF